jgi:hypothetical protein
LSKCGKDVKLVKSYFDNASINKTEGQGQKISYKVKQKNKPYVKGVAT